ncbi:SDR family oxidoreductase [Phenylobacterium sp. LjRoot219]|uniref:SDR family NAD(P)-dependent oxidoreductase n=1 Tax=Phenylobacterium sp. LjRoot219 TaxID=3342283 RepID=UPI003ED12192
MTRGLFDLTGRVVVAAGANSGIGLGFLMGCAKQGADVVVWGRREDRNLEALDRLKAAGAGRAHHEAVDVADEAAVQAAFASTLKVMGRADCVFVNAGFSSRAPSFPDMTSEMYHALMNVNLHGAFYTLREATRHMRDRAQNGDPGGSIVVCGSLSIFHGLQGMEHYAGAKGALAAMVKGLAVEMGQYGVRANMIAPGFIMTEMTQNSPQAEGVIKHFSSITPLGRPGYPEDIEGPAAYLASDASRFQTGDILIVDGGRTVKSL